MVIDQDRLEELRDERDELGRELMRQSDSANALLTDAAQKLIDEWEAKHGEELKALESGALYCEHCGNGPDCIVCGRGAV